MYNLSKEEYLQEIEQIWSGYHLNELKENSEIISENLILSDIRGLYNIAYTNTANFLIDRYEDPEEANVYKEKAAELDPINLSI